MANWHYYTANNEEKIGPITGKELKQLVQQGTITPQTFVEDPSGRTGLAKDVNGLTFPELTLAVESPTVDNPSTVAPFPVSQPVQVPSVAPPPVNVFCTNCGNSISEQAVACMSCGARPVGHKKFCRQCGVALNPEQVVCIKCGAGLTGNSVVSGFAANIASAFQTTDMSKMLNTYFMVFWICMAAGIALILPFAGINIAAQASGGVHPDRQGEFFSTMLPLMLMSYIGYIGLIVGTIFWCMLFYQSWKLIPTSIARTTPGKAVGFLFIPFFNFYWVFVSFLGLSKDMNETLRRRGIQHQVNEGLGLTLCILSILSQLCINLTASFSIIDLLGGLISLAGIIVTVFFTKSVKDGAIALLELGGNLSDALPESTTSVQQVDKTKSWMVSVTIALGSIVLGISLFLIVIDIIVIHEIKSNIPDDFYFSFPTFTALAAKIS
jgi:hypothetical protein